MQIDIGDSGFSLTDHGAVLLESTDTDPMIYVGRGSESVDMYRGNFKIEDYVTERRPLFITGVQQTDDGISLNFQDELKVMVCQDGDCVTLNFEQSDPDIDRFWFRVRAQQVEHCYGCGEQFSYFDLRGNHFPLWTSEAGVGRDPSTELTWRYETEERGGGNYFNTYFPEPTYISSRHYYLHAESTAYADFDFRHDSFHELQFWAVPAFIRIESADTFPELLEKLTGFLGRQPKLPDWAYEGLIVGAQGGKERVSDIIERSEAQGIKVSGVWCQDWSGVRYTSFGKRVNWNWRYDEDLYPDLPGWIDELHERGIRFLAYVSPSLASDGDVFARAAENDAFVKRVDGTVYLEDYGEFDCGTIDLTDQKAFEWYKENVIKTNLLGIGVDGYMCDFGEYLPVKGIVLADGISPMIEHNHWPVLWAELNYEALQETGKLGEVVYYMRSGGTGSQKYCPLMWAGDQSVDFTRHDGLCTAVCAALSSGMTGCGLNYSDIGGFTSVYDNLRTKEVFLRWAEMAVFSPFMRTHEGNRPDTNFQYYDDEDCMRQLARLVDMHVALAPFIRSLVEENAEHGFPVQRPLFFHNEDDEDCYNTQFEYLMGPDVLVAPVCVAGQEVWQLYLPRGDWIHLCTGTAYGGGVVNVPAPVGCPPVFYKRGSRWSSLMEEIRERFF